MEAKSNCLSIALGLLVIINSPAQTALVNGADSAGILLANTTNSYTLAAGAGDRVNLRMGTTGFFGQLYLYGPTGEFLTSAATSSQYDVGITYAVTNTGTFTVLVSSFLPNYSGTYVLNLAQIPEPFVVPTGDDGGPITNALKRHSGTITLGDLDMWSFTACTGDAINLGLNSTNFFGNLRLFGPNGALLATSSGINQFFVSITYAATNCGTFTALVGSYAPSGVGTYALTANGLSDALKICAPVILGTNLILNGVGGASNADFILFSTTNVTTPLEFWTPILTNHFDQFGAFNWVSMYDPASPQRLFRFVVP